MPRVEDGECNQDVSLEPNWKNLTYVPYHWKHFVRESATNEAAVHSSRASSLCWSLSGNECRAAYEEVLAVPSENVSQARVKKEFVRPSVQVKTVPEQRFLNRTQRVNNLMREASENNVDKVIKLLGEKKDINVTDQFGWTMLMCACHAGAVDVASYLLENGANIHVKDKSGYNCISLAKRRKQSAILCLFDTKSGSSERKPIIKEETTRIFCDTCQGYFEESPITSHRNTTLHLFNSHPRKHTTWYGIPDNNKGFELMIKNGWDREQGLGPEGSGTKFPLKTLLKRDRKGLGVDSGIARVTHFKSHDIRAVKLENRVERKYRKEPKISRRSQVSSEKRKERYLRRELNF